MKLDDRPVIDQLLDPTPLNLLDETLRYMTNRLDEREESVGHWISDELSVLDPILDDYMGKAGLHGAHAALSTVAETLRDGEYDRVFAAVREFASEMEARL